MPPGDPFRVPGAAAGTKGGVPIIPVTGAAERDGPVVLFPPPTEYGGPSRTKQGAGREDSVCIIVDDRVSLYLRL